MWPPAPHESKYDATLPQVASYFGSCGGGGFVFKENKLGRRWRGGLGMDGLKWAGLGGVVWLGGVVLLLASFARPGHYDFN